MITAATLTPTKLADAIRMVTRDQRESYPSITHEDAVKQVRHVLTVDMLNDDDQTYLAYRSVLEASESRITLALHIIRADERFRQEISGETDSWRED